MTITPEKIEIFRNMAHDWLKDAQYEELSPRTRADAAFDAAYMYCRVVMAGADEALTHPHEGVLMGAADRLGWSPELMATARLYLDERDDPFRGANRQIELLEIALRLKAAVETGLEPQPQIP